MDPFGWHITCELKRPNSMCRKKLHIYVEQDDHSKISHGETVAVLNERGEWARAAGVFRRPPVPQPVPQAATVIIIIII